MVLPPLELGAVKWIVAEPTPAVAAPMMGAPGTEAGVTLLESAEATLSPITFLAMTLQLTDTPLLRPLTLIGGVRPSAL